MEQSQQRKPLSDYLRDTAADLINAVGLSLHRFGIHPNTISMIGVVMVGLGALTIANGRFVLAGWLILVGSLCDVADGAVARAGNSKSTFGSVLDSTLDRYADGFIFVSFSYYFASQDKITLMLLPLVALIGSFMVSYIRARAEHTEVGISTKIGMFSRFERLTVVIVSLWLHGWLLLPGLWLLAIGTNITAAQRLWFVKQHTG